jgi:hypothetical protein
MLPNENINSNQQTSTNLEINLNTTQNPDEIAIASDATIIFVSYCPCCFPTWSNRRRFDADKCQNGSKHSNMEMHNLSVSVFSKFDILACICFVLNEVNVEERLLKSVDFRFENETSRRREMD